MIIILSPYSGNETENYNKVYEFAEKLMKEGKQVFSPVIYGHIFKYVSDFDGSYKYWEYLNKIFEVADEVYILELKGHENSIGLTKELRKIYAMKKPLEVTYFDGNFKKIKTVSNY